MKHLKKATLAASAFAIAALFSPGWSEQGVISLSVENAQARVGRPLTPMSGAGVARRHARRGAYGAGVYGAGLAGAAVGAAALGTAAAVAGAPYGAYGAYQPAGGPYGAGMGPYGYSQSWDDYAKQNGIACRPGTTIKLDDGRTYPCQ
jgi:hypothetical protein